MALVLHPPLYFDLDLAPRSAVQKTLLAALLQSMSSKRTALR